MSQIVTSDSTLRVACRGRICSLRLEIGHLEGYLHRERVYCSMYKHEALQSAKRSESPRSHGLLQEFKVIRSVSPKLPLVKQQTPAFQETSLQYLCVQEDKSRNM